MEAGASVMAMELSALHHQGKLSWSASVVITPVVHLVIFAVQDLISTSGNQVPKEMNLPVKVSCVFSLCLCACNAFC